MAEHKLGQRRLGERTGIRASQVFNYLHRKLKGETSLNVAQRLEQWAHEMENQPGPGSFQGSPVVASPSRSVAKSRAGKSSTRDVPNSWSTKGQLGHSENLDELEDTDSPVTTYKEYRGVYPTGASINKWTAIFYWKRRNHHCGRFKTMAAAALVFIFIFYLLNLQSYSVFYRLMIH
jgi:hypothetical protein